MHQFNAQQKANAAQLLDQQRQATLSGYLGDMSALALQYKLTQSNPGDPVRAIASARTITAVRDLDGPRKSTLIQDLWEADLIRRPNPIVELFHADLNGAVFTVGANLYQVSLSPVGLSNANFTGAGLDGANLRGSILIGADLIGASLTCRPIDSHTGVCADLSGADLSVPPSTELT